MRLPGPSLRRARLLFVAAVVCWFVALAWWDSLTLLLSAPWLAAIAWVLVGVGLDAAIPADAEPLPSVGELARRRLGGVQ